jgi:hypothetical protein
MNRYLRLAALTLALVPLAYPWGNLVRAEDAPGKTSSGVRYHGGDEIILQGFHWNTVRTTSNDWYATLASLAPTLATAPRAAARPLLARFRQERSRMAATASSSRPPARSTPPGSSRSTTWCPTT